MLSLELLPAAHGDAIWIEYGARGSTHRVLIDGGPAHTYETGLRRRIAALREQDRKLELMVVTHVDADHIDGALILLQDRATLKLEIGELWFNAWEQLPRVQREAFAPLQGEFLGGLISVDAALKAVWNRRFDHHAVVVPEQGRLPEIDLPGGAKLTLLGPGLAELRRLRARWASAIRDFSPGDVQEALRRLRERREYRAPLAPAVFSGRGFGDDRSPANGSSISFVLEYDGVSILLAGDAHARTLDAGLARLAAQRAVTRLRFDAVKLPHHGSMGNVNEAWLKSIDCDQWLFSTSGAVFGHPDVDTARLIAQHQPRQARMLCNYRSPTTERLQSSTGSPAWATHFPEPGATLGVAGGLRLQWEAPSKRARKKPPARRPSRARSRSAAPANTRSTSRGRKS